MVFLVQQRTSNIKTNAYESVFSSALSPEVSNINELTSISISPENITNKNGIDMFSYKTQSDDDKNIVAVRDRKVFYILENIYSDTKINDLVSSNDTFFKLYDKDDDSLIWNIYLGKGIAVAHVGNDVIKKVKFKSGISKTAFMNNHANMLNLTIDEPKAERINIDGQDIDIAMAPAEGLIPCDQVRGAIKKEYGAIIDGNLSCKKFRMMYYSLKLPFEYGQFRNLANIDKPYTIHLRVDNPNDGLCKGKADGKNDLYLYDFNECATSFLRTQHILLHELTHIIKNRNYRQIYQTYNHKKNVENDPNCYDKSFLKTYSLRSTIAKNESISEAAALYFLNGWDGKLGKITNFKNDCTSTDNSIKDKLFSY